MGICGNGLVEGGEDCDDSVETAICDSDCTFATCGDAHHNSLAGETCDAGGESFSCDVDCTAVVCGDGLVNASHNEDCDDAGSSPTCDSDCTAPECGDGVVNNAAIETCDDGGNMSGDGCSSDCFIEGDFGGLCRIVDGTQWCFDNDHCGQACEDVCDALGLTIEPDDATWFAAQDTVAECQAISDAFGLAAPIDFDGQPLGCLEDTGLVDVVGGGLSGGLACSSDAMCPAMHRTAMDDQDSVCNLPGARRSICPCAGAFCGNGLVEGAEICDDGNATNGDGCNTNCTTGPSVCDGGTDPGTGDAYVVCQVDDSGAWLSANSGGSYHAILICQELGYNAVGEYGGTCGNVCGYCEDVTSCDAPGQNIFDIGPWDGGNCGADGMGALICNTVQWTCVF
jgi:cysteine-rich repeat protein